MREWTGREALYIQRVRRLYKSLPKVKGEDSSKLISIMGIDVNDIDQISMLYNTFCDNVVSMMDSGLFEIVYLDKTYFDKIDIHLNDINDDESGFLSYDDILAIVGTCGCYMPFIGHKRVSGEIVINKCSEYAKKCMLAVKTLSNQYSDKCNVLCIIQLFGHGDDITEYSDTLTKAIPMVIPEILYRECVHHLCYNKGELLENGYRRIELYNLQDVWLVFKLIHKECLNYLARSSDLLYDNGILPNHILYKML